MARAAPLLSAYDGVTVMPELAASALRAAALVAADGDRNSEREETWIRTVATLEAALLEHIAEGDSWRRKYEATKTSKASVDRTQTLTLTLSRTLTLTLRP